MRLLSGLLFSSVLALSQVIELTDDTFDKVVLNGKVPTLVKFYASWCGHCKTMAPAYDELGELLASKKNKVQIAKIDADIHKSSGQKYGIKGFPMLKWFKADGTVEDYKRWPEPRQHAGFCSQSRFPRCIEPCDGSERQYIR